MENKRRTEGLMRRRKQRLGRDESPFAVGIVSVVRMNDKALQVQGGCMKPTTKLRIWIQRSWLHPMSDVHGSSGAGLLVLRRKYALQLGFTDSVKKSQSDSTAT